MPGNAVEFTHPGGHVTLECHTDEQPYVLVRMGDTGSAVGAGSTFPIVLTRA